MGDEGCPEGSACVMNDDGKNYCYRQHGAKGLRATVLWAVSADSLDFQGV